jgi:hypothetical protein
MPQGFRPEIPKWLNKEIGKSMGENHAEIP